MLNLHKLPVLLLAWLAIYSSAAHAYNLHHKVLLLSKPGITTTDFVETTLQAYGVPYDLVRVDSSNAASLASNSFWYNADGSGRYSGIFMTPAFEGDGTLNKAQVTNMWAYMSANQVRMVQVAAWPANYGYNVGSKSDGSLACGSGQTLATFAPTLAASNFNVSGVNPAASLSLDGLWRCPGTTSSGWCGIWASDFTSGLGGPCTVSPVLQVTPEAGTTGFTGKATTAWNVNTADGRELLVMTHDCAAWSTTCFVFGHYALAWLLKGLIPGYRRATLNAQVDDMFLATDTDHQAGLRLDSADLTAHKNWHAQVSGLMPPGSSFVTELAFNAAGILEAADVDYAWTDYNINSEDCASNTSYTKLGCNCYLMDYTAKTCTSAHAFCQQCQKNWPKPPNTGTTQLINTYANYIAPWNKAEFTSKDKVFADISTNAGGLADAFYWCHHTHNHLNLDNATYQDASLQIKLNQHMASASFLGMLGRVTFSQLGMVTPQISGLANGDALKALYDAGIRAVMGDNTFAYLMNKTRPYHMYYTSAASSNYVGFPVIPRFATEVYFNCSTAAENLKLYRAIYPQLATDSLETILGREAQRVVSALLQLRHDAHMFHQANMNTKNTGVSGVFGNNASLLMAWIEHMVNEYKKLVNWPIVSLKIDDLYQFFVDREKRDNCKFDYVLNVNSTSGAVQTMTVMAQGSSCTMTAPVIMPATAAVSGAVKEQRGYEAATYWAAPSATARAVTGTFLWGKSA